jgi:hypothetical protein
MRLYKDYFEPISLIFKEKAFCHRYGMSRKLFQLILNGVREYDDYFEPSTIVPVRLGSPLTKNVLRPFGSLRMEC